MRIDRRAPAWAPPLLAVQFLTRLPVPPLARLTPDQARDGLARATGWLPLVGACIGVVTAGVLAAARLVWPITVAVPVALAAEAWLTGAFHEDAVADFCDAFGGHASGDEARRILKDSRIGSYGALGLILAVGLRWAAMAALPPGLATAAIVGAAAIARFWAVALLALCPPAPAGTGVAKDIGALRPRTLGLAVATLLPGVAALAILRPGAVVAAMVAGAAALPLLARLLTRRIGGSTGDCLGFAAYLGQLATMLAACAIG
ncbi:MAG: adenosylcobinamide-GDP ribazoletransferase [Janthinobacterium lividum]